MATDSHQAVSAAEGSAERLRNEARNQARLIITAAQAEAAQIRRTAQFDEIAQLAGETGRTLDRVLPKLEGQRTALARGAADLRWDDTDRQPAAATPSGRPLLLARLGRSIAYWTLVIAVSLALVIALIVFFESQDVSSLEP